MTKLLVFDTHPVQYRYPLWKDLSSYKDICLSVVYASDCSVNGYHDTDFAKKVVWDEPLLEGYKYQFISTNSLESPSHFFSLSTKGIFRILLNDKPDYVLLTGLNYFFDWKALFISRLLGIKVGLRCENQDDAFGKRNLFKSFLRRCIYKLFYSQIENFFYIGEKNKNHYLSFNVPKRKLFPARYFVFNRLENLDTNDKNNIRKSIRLDNDILDDKIVVGFSGKFIDKKDPKVLFYLLPLLPAEITSKIIFYFIGSGELFDDLLVLSKDAFNKYGVRTIFTGFLNQSEISFHYLAIDIFVLPSKFMGETWGLVVNEALHAGCSVIVSNAVGCNEDFNSLERFKIFQTDNLVDFKSKFLELVGFNRNFFWSSKVMELYSLKANSNSIYNVVSSTYFTAKKNK